MAASGRDYHSAKLDAPQLSAPISGNLFADDKSDGYSLIWSRPRLKIDRAWRWPALASGAKTVSRSRGAEPKAAGPDDGPG